MINPLPLPDSYNLERFLSAQQPAYDRVLSELRNGAKQTHWMWFIFPQFAGLGHSSRAQHFAIRSVDEAQAYLDHPVLGARLGECAAIVNGIAGRSAREIFGTPDDLKLRSCATLFAEVSHDMTFVQLLDKYFNGEADKTTLALIKQSIK